MCSFCRLRFLPLRPPLHIGGHLLRLPLRPILPKPRLSGISRMQTAAPSLDVGEQLVPADDPCRLPLGNRAAKSLRIFDPVQDRLVAHVADDRRLQHREVCAATEIGESIAYSAETPHTVRKVGGIHRELGVFGRELVKFGSEHFLVVGHNAPSPSSSTAIVSTAASVLRIYLRLTGSLRRR